MAEQLLLRKEILELQKLAGENKQAKPINKAKQN